MSVVRVELHCHTRYSLDGFMTFASLLKTARAVGLDAVAVTDHDTIDGAIAFRDQALREKVPLTVLIGEERTLQDGSHLIGLFLERPIVSRELPAVIAEIRAQGGFCLIPHPFRRKDGLLRDGLAPLQHFPLGETGFELFSAKSSYAENVRARELLSTSLAPFGGSDAHYECDLGECVNELTWVGDWRQTLATLLRRGAPYAIQGKAQAAGADERRYAPAYYRLKKRIQVPKPWLPAAKQVYRRYRNWRFGAGPKPLREVYRHG